MTERRTDVAACSVGETRRDDSIAAIAARVLTSAPPASRSRAFRWAGTIPGGVPAVVTGAGHLPPIERPDDSARLVRDRLSR